MKTAAWTARESLNFGLLLLASIAVLFVGATMDELHGTPTFYASLAREIVEARDPLAIFRGDAAYLLKPPLVIWLAAASSAVLGLSEFAVTLPSRLAAVLAIAFAYLLFRRLLGSAAAWIAALVLLTNSTFIQFSTTLRMDSMLLAGMLCAIAGAVHLDRRWGAALMFGGIAVGVLAKGPLGLLPLVLIPPYFWLCQPGRPPIRWRWSLLLLPALAWYAFLAFEHGGRPFTELGADAVRASAAAHSSLASSAIDNYLLLPLRRYWPWLPFLLAGLGWAAVAVVRADIKAAPQARWLLCWIVIVVVPATLKPDHDIRYLYPALPALAALAALAAVVIAHLLQECLPAWLPAAATAVIVSLALAVSTFGREVTDHRVQIRGMAAYIEAADVANDALLAVGAYPYDRAAPRRQNTHRDWVHFYLGRWPDNHLWVGLDAAGARSREFVLAANDHVARDTLQRWGFRIQYRSAYMILAVRQ